MGKFFSVVAIGVLVVVAIVYIVVEGIGKLVANLPLLTLAFTGMTIWVILILLGAVLVVFGPIVIGLYTHRRLTHLLAKSNRIKDLDFLGHLLHVMLFIVVSIGIAFIWYFLIPHLGDFGSITKIIFPWNMDKDWLGTTAWIGFVVLGAGWAWMIELDST